MLRLHGVIQVLCAFNLNLVRGRTARNTEVRHAVSDEGEWQCDVDEGPLPMAPHMEPDLLRRHPRFCRTQKTQKTQECVICMEAPGCVELRPCGHDQFCQTCVRKVRTCPLCRATMTSWQDGRIVCIFGTPIWL